MAERIYNQEQDEELESFLEKFDSEWRSAATRLTDEGKRAGAEVDLGTSALSIRAQCSRWPEPITVVWMYPPDEAGSAGLELRNFIFGYAEFKSDAVRDEELYAILKRYADTFRDDAFTKEIVWRDMEAWEILSRDAVEHIDLLVGRVTGVLAELADLKPL